MFSADQFVPLYKIYDTTAHLMSDEVAKNSASFCICSMDCISVSISDMCKIPCFYRHSKQPTSVAVPSVPAKNGMLCFVSKYLPLAGVIPFIISCRPPLSFQMAAVFSHLLGPGMNSH